MFKKKKKINPRNPNLNTGESQVYSYRSARKDNDRQYGRETDQDRQSKLPNESKFTAFKKLAKVFIVTSAVVFILCAISYVKAVGTLTIDDGSNKSKKDAYTRTINDQLKLSLQNKNFWLIDQDKITNKLKSDFPEIQKVAYNYSLMNREVNVQIIISQPVLVLSSVGNNYLIDSRGRVVEESYSSSGLATLIDGDNREYKKGDLALLTDNINYIDNILAQSKAKNYVVERLSIEHGATELYVKYKGFNYFVKYSLQEDPRISFGTFEVAKEKSGQTPTEYIDVRVADRAYIK